MGKTKNLKEKIDNLDEYLWTDEQEVFKEQLEEYYDNLENDKNIFSTYMYIVSTINKMDYMSIVVSELVEFAFIDFNIEKPESDLIVDLEDEMLTNEQLEKLKSFSLFLIRILINSFIHISKGKEKYFNLDNIITDEKPAEA